MLREEYHNKDEENIAKINSDLEKSFVIHFNVCSVKKTSTSSKLYLLGFFSLRNHSKNMHIM